MTIAAGHAAPSLIIRSVDIGEKLLITGGYGLLVGRMAAMPAPHFTLVDLLILVSEGLAVAFVLLRRGSPDVSLDWTDWLIALIGSMMPLCVRPTISGTSLAAPAFAAILMLYGLGLLVWAKLTIRRSFGIVPANRGVKAGGPYRLVRHPMYAGYLLTYIGFFITNPSWWNAAVYVATIAVLVLRILREERLLGRDPAYRALMGRTGYRLLPPVF